jgi:site-specific recombinase XerD
LIRAEVEAVPQAQVRPQRKRATPARAARRETSWQEAVDAFLAAKRAENLSPSTLENYAWHLTGVRAQTFLRDHEITSPRQLTAEALEALQAELLDAGVSPALTHAFHRVWKNFAGFCIRRGYGADPDVLTVKGPKQPMREPETFSPAEEKQMLAATRSPRDRLIMELLLRTGLRLEELCALTVDDIIDGPEGSYLRVRQGKGAKDRIVPLDTPRVKVSKQLRQYMRNVRPSDTSSRALFVTSRKSGDEYEPLSARGVQLMMRRISEVTGIHIHPHKFRHTFATRALAAGVDVMALQRVLGHTTLAMVSRYVHYQKDDLIAAWNKRRD